MAPPPPPPVVHFPTQEEHDTELDMVCRQLEFSINPRDFNLSLPPIYQPPPPPIPTPRDIKISRIRNNNYIKDELRWKYLIPLSQHKPTFMVPNPLNIEHGSSSLAGDAPLNHGGPPAPRLYGCASCQILRELVHTNGSVSNTIEIHGKIGTINHAIVEIKYLLPSGAAQPEYYIFDFSKKSITDVHDFISEYCDDRRKAGFTKHSDPLSVFYEALCVGMGFDNCLDIRQIVANQLPEHGASSGVNVENMSNFGSVAQGNVDR